MLTQLIKTLVSVVFKLTDCGNGTVQGSFAFEKNPRFIGYHLPTPHHALPDK
jgi:hypothetical protein